MFTYFNPKHLSICKITNVRRNLKYEEKSLLETKIRGSLPSLHGVIQDSLEGETLTLQSTYHGLSVRSGNDGWLISIKRFKKKNLEILF